jgi:hypothetical protein
MTRGSAGGGSDRQPSADAAHEQARAELRAAIRRAASAEEAARIAGVPKPNSLHVPRWFGLAVATGAVLFVPWIVYLAVELPTRVRTSRYDLMWVGFDVAMWAVLVGLAVAAVRRSTWTEPLAVCAATFLVLDAWFDIVTSDSREDLVWAVLSAAFIELPAAAVCAWIAHNAEVIRRRAYGRLFHWATHQWWVERSREHDLLQPARVVTEAQHEYDSDPELRDLLTRAAAAPAGPPTSNDLVTVEGGCSEIADAQLDALEAGADVDLYNAVLAACELIFRQPAQAQALSTAISTTEGIRMRLPVAGQTPHKIFWSDGPRIEAVFPHP